MAYLLSAGKALPVNEMEQVKTVEFAKSIFKKSFKDINRLLTVFQNGEIQRRQFVEQLDWYKEIHTLAEKNQLYIKKCCSIRCSIGCEMFNKF